MIDQRTLSLLACLLVAAPVHAATLPQTLRHWTGVTAKVTPQGDRVRIEPATATALPAFTALAAPATVGGDGGWRLNDITLPPRLRLQDGAVLTFGGQHSDAWLGGRTAEVKLLLDGMSESKDRRMIDLDRAAVSLASLGGPVALNVELTGPHIPDDPAMAKWLPHDASLRGHTTPDGAAALMAMFSGGKGAPAPVTIERLGFDSGPAQFTASGNVTVLSRDEANGEISLSAQHFGDLIRALQQNGADARVFATLMILRQLGHKQDGAMHWTVTLAGKKVQINGIDISVLLGM